MTYTVAGSCQRSRVVETLRGLSLKYVPVVWSGPYSYGAVESHTSGKTRMPGGKHIREGVVVRPWNERDDPEFGRVILKSVAQDYLLRSGGTEFN